VETPTFSTTLLDRERPGLGYAGWPVRVLLERIARHVGRSGSHRGDVVPRAEQIVGD
jgi:hypothetical protein